MLSVPIVTPLTISGTMIIASGSNGVPGTWIERGSRWARLARTASPWEIDPTGQPDLDRAFVGEDQLGERSRATTARRMPAARSSW